MPSAGPEDVQPQEIAPGDASRLAQWGGITVAFEKAHGSEDASVTGRDLQDDSCQAQHWGFLFSGKIVVHYADRSETIEAGRAYYIEPGHAIEFLEDSEAVEFTPTDRLDQLVAEATPEAHTPTELTAARDRLAVELDLAQARITQLETELGTAQSRIEQLASELEASRELMSELKGKKSADDLGADAVPTAADVLQMARRHALEIVALAEADRERVLEEVKRLEQHAESSRAAVSELLQSLLAELDGESAREAEFMGCMDPLEKPYVPRDPKAVSSTGATVLIRLPAHQEAQKVITARGGLETQRSYLSRELSRLALCLRNQFRARSPPAGRVRRETAFEVDHPRRDASCVPRDKGSLRRHEMVECVAPKPTRPQQRSRINVCTRGGDEAVVVRAAPSKGGSETER